MGRASVSTGGRGPGVICQLHRCQLCCLGQIRFLYEMLMMMGFTCRMQSCADRLCGAPVGLPVGRHLECEEPSMPGSELGPYSAGNGEPQQVFGVVTTEDGYQSQAPRPALCCAAPV